MRAVEINIKVNYPLDVIISYLLNVHPIYIYILLFIDDWVKYCEIVPSKIIPGVI
jgi:hypothetical protein